ncbi:MAG TPA: amino acid ABC transporter substrate-binding protein [Acetobacteraceae bacterium]|nr:amino acid ABC transporter substrate-binding protein [Acetobacteraceae bacterium]
MIGRCAAACLALCIAGAARAEEGATLSGTLQTIHDRSTILIGYRDASLPFSFLNKAHQPVGFSLDICHGIAEDAARAVHQDLLEPDAPAWQQGLRIVYVPVAADERLPKLVSGAIDLECGSTTANAERARTVAFSPVFFLAGTKLMVPANGKVASYRDLAGGTVAVSTGTTNAEALRRLADRVTPPIKVVETPGLDQAYAMLVAGKAEAFASDDTLLAGFIATRPEGHSFQIVGDYLSFEPYAIALRRDDPAFAALVRDAFARMAGEGTLNRLYARWLVDRLPTGETLAVPMSAQLAEMYRVLGQPD